MSEIEGELEINFQVDFSNFYYIVAIFNMRLMTDCKIRIRYIKQFLTIYHINFKLYIGVALQNEHIRIDRSTQYI